MRVTYVARSFLDYRVPVLSAVNERLGGQLTFLYSADYVPVRCQQRLAAALGPGGIGLRGEWRLGPDQISGFANRSVRLVYQPGIWRAIAASRPDVVVGDGFFQWTSFAVAWRLRARVGLVVCYERTAHTERAAQWYRRAYRRQVLRVVDAMACNGSLSRDYLCALGMDPARITVGQMAADAHQLAARVVTVTPGERAEWRSRWGSPALVFLVVGRLIRLKGIAELLRAWGLFQEQRPGPWALVVVGEGPEQGALEAQARAAGLRGVFFAGPVDYGQMAAVYAAADVLVSGTLEDNWSLVVPEAMACGLPVLCSIYNGCHPELVMPGRNGWTFDPLDTRATAAAFLGCVEQGGGLPGMGAHSRAIAAGFTPEHAADAILGACELAARHRDLPVALPGPVG